MADCILSKNRGEPDEQGKRYFPDRPVVGFEDDLHDRLSSCPPRKLRLIDA